MCEVVLINSESSLSSLQMGYFHRANFSQAGVYQENIPYYMVAPYYIYIYIYIPKYTKEKYSFPSAHFPPHSKENPLSSSWRDAVGREPQASVHLPENVNSSASCTVWPPFFAGLRCQDQPGLHIPKPLHQDSTATSTSPIGGN